MTAHLIQTFEDLHIGGAEETSKGLAVALQFFPKNGCFKISLNTERRLYLDKLQPLESWTMHNNCSVRSGEGQKLAIYGQSQDPAFPQPPIGWVELWDNYLQCTLGALPVNGKCFIQKSV